MKIIRRRTVSTGGGGDERSLRSSSSSSNSCNSKLSQMRKFVIEMNANHTTKNSNNNETTKDVNNNCTNERVGFGMLRSSSSSFISRMKERGEQFIVKRTQSLKMTTSTTSTVAKDYVSLAESDTSSISFMTESINNNNNNNISLFNKDNNWLQHQSFNNLDDRNNNNNNSNDIVVDDDDDVDSLKLLQPIMIAHHKRDDEDESTEEESETSFSAEKNSQDEDDNENNNNNIPVKILPTPKLDIPLKGILKTTNGTGTTTTTTTTTIKKKAGSSSRIKKKFVKFLCDDTGALITNVKHIESISKRHEMFHKIWWSKDDIKRTRREATIAVHFVSKCIPEYKVATVQLQTKFGILPSIWMDNDDNDNNNTNDTNNDDNDNLDNIDNDKKKNNKKKKKKKEKKLSDEEAVDIISGCEVRGLEKFILPCISLPPPLYCRANRRLIMAQRRLRNKHEELNEKQMAKRLARLYIKDTQTSMIWARLIADGDARTRDVINKNVLYRDTPIHHLKEQQQEKKKQLDSLTNDNIISEKEWMWM